MNVKNFNLEPEALNTNYGFDTTIMLSIAISMKRIADITEGKNIKQPIFMSADEYARFQGRDGC